MSHKLQISFLLNSNHHDSVYPSHAIPLRPKPSESLPFLVIPSIRSSSSSSSPPSPISIKPKRKRANSYQIRELEAAFHYNQFPSAEMRKYLGHQLGMTPRTVQIWFQNKRQALDIRRPTVPKFMSHLLR